MIKALVKKELRENVMVAALGMVGAILLTAWTYHDYKTFITISPDHPHAINIGGQLQPVVLARVFNATGVVVRVIWGGAGFHADFS